MTFSFMVHWIWKLGSHRVIWTGSNSLKKKKKKNFKNDKTHKKKQTKLCKEEVEGETKKRLFTKLALVSENADHH